MWMYLETVRQNEVRKRRTNIIYERIYVESRSTEEMTYLQGRTRDEDIENRQVDAGWEGRVGQTGRL